MKGDEVLCGQMNLVVLPLLTGDEELDAIEMSKVSERDSVSVYTPNTCMRRQRRVEAAGRHHRARVMKRTKFLAPKPNWAKETELRNNAWKLLESEGRKPSVQLEERREEAKPEDECQMDVDSGADIRKKLDQRRKET